MPGESEDPSSSYQHQTNGHNALVKWLKTVIKPKSDPSLREAIEGYIDESDGAPVNASERKERALITNILKLRDITVTHVMIPRADIVAIEAGITRQELLALLSEKQFSRIPVYRENLDNVLGTIHIKDVLASLARNKEISIAELITEIPVVSPSLPVLDLILKMQQDKRHMALVVDEFGGIDGLVTIGDVIEAIVGEIEDEHDNGEGQKITEKDDGSVLADARMDIDEFEERFGNLFTREEHEESDTLGGLVSFIAGRVPSRGEILTHSTGMVFEVLDADPRRVNRLKIRNIPRTARG